MNHLGAYTTFVHFALKGVEEGRGSDGSWGRHPVRVSCKEIDVPLNLVNHAATSSTKLSDIDLGPRRLK
jgi:hypothetical protein